MKVLNQVRKHPRVQTVNEMPSKTVQSDVFRTEIRHILAKYKEVGIVEHMRHVDLEYRDVSEFEDFSDLMRQSTAAEQAFMRLPSKVREVFKHDVGNWLDAAHDPEKMDALKPEFAKLGLFKVEDVPALEAQRRGADGRFVTDEPPLGGSK